MMSASREEFCLVWGAGLLLKAAVVGGGRWSSDPGRGRPPQRV